MVRIGDVLLGIRVPFRLVHSAVLKRLRLVIEVVTATVAVAAVVEVVVDGGGFEVG